MSLWIPYLASVEKRKLVHIMCLKVPYLRRIFHFSKNVLFNPKGRLFRRSPFPLQEFKLMWILIMRQNDLIGWAEWLVWFEVFVTHVGRYFRIFSRPFYNILSITTLRDWNVKDPLQLRELYRGTSRDVESKWTLGRFSCVIIVVDIIVQQNSKRALTKLSSFISPYALPWLLKNATHADSDCRFITMISKILEINNILV